MYFAYSKTRLLTISVVHYRGQIVASVTNFRNLLVQFHLPTYRQFSVTVKENTILARYGIHGIQCGLDSPLEVFSVHFKFFNKMGISVGLILAQKVAPCSLILLQKQIVGERKAAQAYNDFGVRVKDCSFTTLSWRSSFKHTT